MPFQATPAVVGGAILAAGTAVLGYKKFLAPALQSMKGRTASGAPMQVVVPVGSGPAPQSGVSVTPPAPWNQGKVKKTIPLSLPGSGIKWIAPKRVDPTAPVIITPGGASNFSVSTVGDVQKALNVLGYASPPLPVTNALDAATSAAIRQFQAARGFTADGQDSQGLHMYLELAMAQMAAHNPVGALPNVQATTSPPPQVTTAKDVQHALNLLGASPQLAEDGATGPKTIAAIKAFQISHGLVADGVAGPQTKQALVIALQGQANVTVAGFGADMHVQHGDLELIHRSMQSAAMGNAVTAAGPTVSGDDWGARKEGMLGGFIIG